MAPRVLPLHLSPAGSRVLVRCDPAPRAHGASGLIVPEQHRACGWGGVVVALGPRCTLDVRAGQRVILDPGRGIKFVDHSTIDEGWLLLVDEDVVLGVESEEPSADEQLRRALALFPALASVLATKRHAAPEEVACA